MQTNIEKTNQEDSGTLRERARSDIQDLKERASSRLDQATTSVGRGVERAGDAVDNATHTAADGVKRAGRYMQESDPATMADDFVELARKHPGATLCVGIGLGLLAGRVFRPRTTR